MRSILTRWLIILLNKKYKPNALPIRKISKKWMVYCSKKLSATKRLRHSLLKLRLNTVLLRHALSMMTDISRRKYSSLREAWSKFPFCTKTLSMSAQFWNSRTSNSKKSTTNRVSSSWKRREVRKSKSLWESFAAHLILVTSKSKEVETRGSPLHVIDRCPSELK